MWNPEVQCLIHMSSTIILILSQTKPVPPIDTYFFKIHYNVVPAHLRLGLPKVLFPVGLPVKILKAFLLSSIQAICPAHLNFLHLITLTTLGERNKLWSSSLWSLLHSPFSYLLGTNIRLGILFSNTLSLHSSLNARDHASQHIAQLAILLFCIF